MSESISIIPRETVGLLFEAEWYVFKEYNRWNHCGYNRLIVWITCSAGIGVDYDV